MSSPDPSSPQPPTLIDQLKTISTFTEFAEFFDMEHTRLRFILYNLRDKHYSETLIPKRKKGEFRKISQPHPALRILQDRLLPVFEEIYQPRPSTYGFIASKSIVDNARYHRKGTKPKFVLNVDLKDFFPSIHLGRVRGLLSSSVYGLSLNVATWVAQIVAKPDGLPQGAPTSPVISNMICSKLDYEMQKLAQRYRCKYTRYADDITFSTSIQTFPRALAFKHEGQVLLGEELAQVIANNGFKPNLQKIKLTGQSQRQEVTGLIINRGVNVRRTYIRNVRAMLHDWEKNGLDQATVHHLSIRRKHRAEFKPNIDFPEVVRGKIEFIGLVRGKNDPIYRRLLLKLNSLAKSTVLEERIEHLEGPTVFISYERRDEPVVQTIFERLEKAGYKPWKDNSSIRTGELWERSIFEGIENCDFFMPILSKNYNKKRGMIQREIDAALKKLQGMLEDDIYLVPVRIDKENPPSKLKSIQYRDYPEQFDIILKDMTEGIKKRQE